jgi:heterodisulfide reductase subunit B
MRYAYYPGCSASHSAAAYDRSLKAVLEILAQELVEIDDWNCCGATEYFSLNPLPAYALIARNLALAEEAGMTDLVAPCSACYLNLFKTDDHMGKYAQIASDVNEALAEAHLHYHPGAVKPRHALDIIYTDIGCDVIEAYVTNPLTNLRLAPYYGCLIVRPDHGFDNPEYPMSLDYLLEALGATVVDYSLKAACCGGHMPMISPEAAFGLIHELIATAVRQEADAIVTICPMCYLNLDMFQAQANRHYGTNYTIPVLYFTQLMGLAYGLSAEQMGFGQELVSAQQVLDKLAAPPEEVKTKKPRRDKKALPMPSILTGR